MIRIGKQHRKGDRFALHHGKNDSDTDIRIIAPLAEALDALQHDHLTYLVTERGHPYATGNSFYNWFHRACVKAGIPHCSPHGLRKAMSRRLAESDATTLQGRAITGHKTDKEFARYAERADRAAMADNAMANLENWLAKKGEQSA